MQMQVQVHDAKYATKVLFRFRGGTANSYPIYKCSSTDSDSDSDSDSNDFIF